MRALPAVMSEAAAAPNQIRGAAGVKAALLAERRSKATVVVVGHDPIASARVVVIATLISTGVVKDQYIAKASAWKPRIAVMTAATVAAYFMFTSAMVARAVMARFARV